MPALKVRPAGRVPLPKWLGALAAVEYVDCALCGKPTTVVGPAVPGVPAYHRDCAEAAGVEVGSDWLRRGGR